MRYSIKVRLSDEQVAAVTAIGKFADLSDADTITSLAVYAMNLLFDSPEEMRNEIRNSVDPKIQNGKLPCGMEVYPGVPKKFVERVIEAECRKIARMFREDPASAGMQFDPRSGVIRVKHGGAYRWTGRKIAAIAA